MTIKAIRTTYKGIEFRSRTEARWALYFDELGIPWEYEREGYELAAGWYVPDFWLPRQEIWWEVKGQHPTEKEIAMAHELAAVEGHNVYIAVGGPSEQANSDGAFVLDEHPGVWNVSQRWAECLICGRLGVVFGGQPEWRQMCGHPENVPHNRSYEIAESRMDRAIEATKRQSFWEPK